MKKNCWENEVVSVVKYFETALNSDKYKIIYA